MMLGQTGYPFADIPEADSSRTALIICNSSPVDVVFCDLNLTTFGSKDGVGITRELRQMFPDIPIFMVTAEDDESLIAEERAAGATGHLLKPISLRTLRRILQPCWALPEDPRTRPAENRSHG
jgi:CheY-like chemotaxis protein